MKHLKQKILIFIMTMFVANVIIDMDVTVLAASVTSDEFLYTSDGLVYMVNENDTITIIGYSGNGGDVEIPSVIDEKPVTAIGSWAFCIWKGTDFDIIQNGVTSITIPDSVTTIGEGAFYRCESLTNITIPDGVTTIERSTFLLCTSLTNITIPGSVTRIGSWAFQNCTNLTDITISDGVTSIGGYDDSAYDILSYMGLLAGPSNWSGMTFAHCYNLTSIFIPDSVTYIGENTFEGVNNIVIYYKGTKAEFEKITNPYFDYNATVTVHYESAFPNTNAHSCENGHVEVTDEGFPATCTKSGYTNGIHCSVCGKVLVKRKDIAAFGHYWSSWSTIRPASSTKDGKRARSCTVCGKSELQTIPRIISKLTAKNKKKKSVALTWKKVSKADGYEIQYATKKNFKSCKKKTSKKTKITIKKLKKKKTYYFRVRAYRWNGKEKVYGKWSVVKKVKIKK